jgi:hypothetical protein
MDPNVLIRLVESPEFQRGLIAGIVLVAIGLFAHKLSIDWGLLWAPAVVVAGIWANVINLPAIGRALLLDWWVAPAAAITAAVVAHAFATNQNRVELAPAFSFSLAGVWATVPDTEQIMVLLGVTTALIWLWWPRPLVAPKPVGTLVVATLAVGAGAVGAVGRPGAYVGAFGALASLALLSYPRRPSAPWWGFLAHMLLVIGWSRIAGLSDGALPALMIGTALTVTVLGARYLVATTQDRVSANEPD